MSSINRIFASAVYLTAAVLAAPATQNPSSSSSVMQPRWQECEAGTWYSKCGDVDGCFNYDACTTQDGSAPTPAPACPTDDIKEAGLRVMPSSYWSTNPKAPNERYSEKTIIHVVNDTSRSDGFNLEQVLVFEGIDVSRARICKLNWYMDLQPETQFEVEGGGYVKFTLLPGFPVPKEAPSYSFVQQFETEDAASFTPSMGGWDDKSQYLGQTKQSSAVMPCAEVLAFSAKMETFSSGSLDEIYMVPSDTIGMSVDYWC